MTNSDLIKRLIEFDPHAEVCIVAADMGLGGDTYAPLDIVKGVGPGLVLVGANQKMCHDLAEPHPTEN